MDLAVELEPGLAAESQRAAAARLAEPGMACPAKRLADSPASASALVPAPGLREEEGVPGALPMGQTVEEPGCRSIPAWRSAPRIRASAVVQQ